VENELNPTGEKTPEQIQEEMAQTREALTEKVAALENQVVGTAKTAADTISSTVEAVKSMVEKAPETVRHAAEAVSETMRDVFDISGHVRHHPWASVGASTGLGFLTGLLVFRGRTEATIPPVPVMPAATPVAPPRSSAPGMFDELFAMIGRKVREVAENVINTATASVNQQVRDGVPKLVDAATEMAADRLGPTSHGNGRASFGGATRNG